MRKFICLVSIFFVLGLTSSGFAAKRCREMKNLNMSATLAKQMIRSFLLREVADSEFRVVTDGENVEYVVLERPIDGLPRTLRSQGKLYWGVRLGGVRSVSIVSVVDSRVAGLSELAFVVSLRRNIEDQDELSRLYRVIRNLGRGVSVEGWYTSRSWKVRFATLNGFLQSSRLISELPREFVEYSKLNPLASPL